MLLRTEGSPRRAPRSSRRNRRRWLRGVRFRRLSPWVFRLDAGLAQLDVSEHQGGEGRAHRAAIGCHKVTQRVSRTCSAILSYASLGERLEIAEGRFRTVGGNNGRPRVLARDPSGFRCWRSRWVCNARRGLGPASVQTLGETREIPAPKPGQSCFIRVAEVLRPMGRHLTEARSSQVTDQRPNA